MRKNIEQHTEKWKEYIENEAPILFFKVLPNVVMEKLTKYFRVEVEGIENIPRRGAAIVAPNHSGFSGLDAMVLNYQIYKQSGRLARLLTHKLWFTSDWWAEGMNKLGFIKATRTNGVDNLKRGRCVIIFPEGEEGNFKPSSQMYVLQEFRRGFVRMALEAQCPIVPTLILGAEETNFNFAKLKLPRWMQGLIMPLPINFLPLPARWKIVFLEPFELPYKPESVEDNTLVREIAEEIQERLQERLNEEIKKRGKIYL